MDTTPLVIVGAGPAGLAAAHALLAAGRERFRVVDAGGPVHERRRTSAADTLEGAGGAGLYSDGKFSFYPSASALWSLPQRGALDAACRWTGDLLRRHGLEAPSLTARPAQGVGPDGFKPYPSIYMPLAERRAVIDGLTAPLADRLRLRTRLAGLAREGEHLVLDLRGPGGTQRLRCQRLIGAGGRFFPLLLQAQGLVPRTFRRLELGVRIEGPATHPFFADLLAKGQSIDPKLIVRGEDGVEWRTFCCCAQGEVVETEGDGLRTLSGRSDCPPTGRSNVGFNVRFRSPAAGVSLEAPRAHGVFALPLPAALDGPELLVPGFGARAAAALQRGLQLLAERVPSLLHEPERLTVRGPTVEGVGHYPQVDGDLAVPGLPIHLAGDCGGVFRGIVAALVSGHYAGRLAAGALESEGLAYSARP